MLKGGSTTQKGKGKGKPVAADPIVPTKGKGKGKPVAADPIVPTDKGESSAEEKPNICKYGTQRIRGCTGSFDQGPVGSYGHLGKARVPLLPQWKRPFWPLLI